MYACNSEAQTHYSDGVNVGAKVLFPVQGALLTLDETSFFSICAF